jgi:hypothetical protein
MLPGLKAGILFPITIAITSERKADYYLLSAVFLLAVEDPEILVTFPLLFCIEHLNCSALNLNPTVPYC